MHEIQMFIERHEHLHSALIPNLLSPLTPDQIRIRPEPRVNSIAWILWHMARTEDFAFTRIIGGQPQVLNQEWLQRLDVPLIHQGTGMNDEEVAELTARIDIPALRQYYDAVGHSTRAVVAALTSEQLGDIPEDNHVRHVFIDEGVYTVSVQSWAVAQRLNRPLWWWLTSRITHQYVHYGEAVTVRSLLGIPGTY